jgi:hypothetical protein
VISAVTIATVIAGWLAMYPSGDPKNIRYVLWKRDLFDMNLDVATQTMVGDAARDQLVIGKTKDELRQKFKYLETASETTEYLRACYNGSNWKDKHVLFIKNSAWMIVFDGQKATNLVLVKGC